MAYGAAFQNANSPVPMLKIGTAGQTGVAQLVDFMISTRGPQPGAKLIEWNMHDPANAPGRRQERKRGGRRRGPNFLSQVQTDCGMFTTASEELRARTSERPIVHAATAPMPLRQRALVLGLCSTLPLLEMLT